MILIENCFDCMSKTKGRWSARTTSMSKDQFLVQIGWERPIDWCGPIGRLKQFWSNNGRKKWIGRRKKRLLLLTKSQPTKLLLGRSSLLLNAFQVAKQDGYGLFLRILAVGKSEEVKVKLSNVPKPFIPEAQRCLSLVQSWLGTSNSAAAAGTWLVKSKVKKLWTKRP